MGEIVSELPTRCLWAEWDKDIYLEPPIARFEVDGRQLQDALAQFSLEVEESDAHGVRLLLEGPGLETRIQFKITESPQFSYLSGDEQTVELVSGRRPENLIEYLNDNSHNLMLDDWSRICGEEHFPAPNQTFAPFSGQRITVIDWKAGGVDIAVEYADNHGNVIPASIQSFLERELNNDTNVVVFWDHGSGEAADFVVLRHAANNGVRVILYHCKSAGGAEPGNRVVTYTTSAHKQ